MSEQATAAVKRKGKPTKRKLLPVGTPGVRGGKPNQATAARMLRLIVAFAQFRELFAEIEKSGEAAQWVRGWGRDAGSLGEFECVLHDINDGLVLAYAKLLG
jgi:hypothetical protein